MARTPGSSGSGRSTRSTGSRTSVRTTPGRTTKKEPKKQSHLGPIPLFEFGDIETLIAGPLAWALGQSKRTKPVSNVLSAAATSPYFVARHPGATAGDVEEIIRGIPEGVAATYRSIRDEGLRDTGGMMLDAMIADYKARYGSDWRENAEKDPLFNLLDLTAVFGGGVRGAAMGKAFADLGKAGIARTPRSVWKETARPGYLSEGQTRPRRLQYQPEVGEMIESFQTPSRSPLRRGTQDIWDALAERYPTMPVAGARARITRSNARTLERETDRVLSQVSDPHAVEALSQPLRSRLFWAAQLGDHSTSALKEFRDLLGKALKSTDPEDLPDDLDFRETVLEAKKRGFGQQLLNRLDKAIEAKPDDRYWRAADTMKDATDLSERTMRDAHGFEGLKGDIKRATDRLRGMDPDLADDVARLSDDRSEWEAFLDQVPPEMRQAVMDVGNPRLRLAEIDGDLAEMFRDRRNRVRDWRDQQILKNNPIRAAFLQKMTDAWGTEKAEAAIKLYDAVARASGDPEDWYRRAVGESGERVEDFLARTEGKDALFQRQQILGALGQEFTDSTFYSPLQKYVLDDMPARVQARQLPGILTKHTRKEELKETGILDWIESFDPNQKITKDQVVEYLSNPANSYSLEEIHRSSRSSRWKPLWRDLPGLSAVRDSRAEAHQFIFRMPVPARYRGKGSIHWGTENPEEGTNVVAHLRFHVLDHNGLKTMVVEEAQSDWLSQWLKAKPWQKKLTPEQKEFGRRSIEMDKAEDESWIISEELDGLRGEMERAIDDGDPNAEELIHRYENRRDDYHAAEERYDELQRSLAEDLDDAGIEDFDLVHHWAGAMETPEAPITEELLHSMLSKKIVRWAADHEIEQIVVPDGDVHRMRYMQTSRSLAQGTQDTATITRRLRSDPSEHNDPGGNMLKRYYDPGSGINKALARELGIDGGYSDTAFRGRYAYENERQGQSKMGDMPGTVFRLSEELRTQHKGRPKAFKQQSKWDELPKGAMEMLEDGRRVIHLFKGADPSTAIHELAHTALFDLPAEDLLTIEDFLAGGRKLADWTESDHETYARAFEQYVRRGEAPSPELESAFQKLSGWMKAIWEAVKGSPEADLDPAVIRVFDALLTRDERPDVDTFIPHRTGEVELSGARTSRGIPRASRDIGDRALSRIPLFARNRLALLRMGMLNDDPRLLIEHTNRIVMLARANQLRETVLEMGHPLMPNEVPDFEKEYVVKKTGRGVDRPLFDAVEAADDPAEIRDTIKNYVDDYITDDRQKWEAWRGEQQLYVVDKKVVDLLFKNVTGKTPGATTKPGGVAGQLGDAVLDSVRAMLLYANPGFYTANLIGNMSMLGFSDPRAFRFLGSSFKQAIKAARKPDTADPLWRRISVQMGRGPTSGGLSTRPPLLGRQGSDRGPLVGRAAETASLAIQGYGRRSGRVIDDAMRVAAWKQVAAKLDYDTDAKIEKLLDDASGGKLRDEGPRPSQETVTKAKRDLDAIRDEAEQLMLDFDSMSPFEKTWLTRAIFLYPFLKASAKWPVMALGERPVASWAAGQAGAIGSELTTQQLGERPDLPLWMAGQARMGGGRYLAAGQFAPIAPISGLIASFSGLGGTPETGISRPIDYLNPFTQLMVELAQGRSQFGQELPAHEIIRRDAPMTALQRQLLHLKDPSEVYADRSLWATLLRSLRFLPYEVDEPVAKATAERQRG